MMKTTPAAIQAALNGDINLLAASTPGGIERQEAEGQQSFVASQTLPKECPKQELEALGFNFLSESDDIFVNVQFPEGWSIKPTDHSMWNDLIDSKGRKRGSIFYKAAFYDRSAHMSLDRRYSYRPDYDVKDGVQYVVTDCDEVIFRTRKIECEQYSDEYWDADKTCEEAVKVWIDGKFPKWENSSAYWD